MSVQSTSLARNQALIKGIYTTLPETNLAPENQSLENELSSKAKGIFQGQTVSFMEGIFHFSALPILKNELLVSRTVFIHESFEKQMLP